MTKLRKRFRPRISVRFLLLIVALLCAYVACWPPTKTQGVTDIEQEIGDFVRPIPVAPLLIRTTELGNYPNDPIFFERYFHRYQFWFFGLTAYLPYEREITPQEAQAEDLEEFRPIAPPTK